MCCTWGKHLLEWLQTSYSFKWSAQCCRRLINTFEHISRSFIIKTNLGLHRKQCHQMSLLLQNHFIGHLQVKINVNVDIKTGKNVKYVCLCSIFQTTQFEIQSAWCFLIKCLKKFTDHSNAVQMSRHLGILWRVNYQINSLAGHYSHTDIIRWNYTGLKSPTNKQ